MKAVSGVAIRAISAAVPIAIARTQDYEFMAEHDRLRFQKATGIAERRVSPATQYASDLCAAAAIRALDHLQWDRQSIGALILITQTADQPIPATAVVLQHKLGLSQECAAFDINLGCSAYPYGIAVASSMMQSLGISRALLLMGDVSSRVCAIHDKSAWPLFGDAGSATALELRADAPAMHFDLMSDGSGKDAIIVPGGGLASRRPPGAGPIAEESGPDGILRRPDNLVLRGADIFSFAITKAAPSIKRVLDKAERSPVDTDFLLLHQANRMINDTVTKKAGFSALQALSTLSQYGNTSSASIPLTLCAHANEFTTEKFIVVCGFGVGLSWASATLMIPKGSVLPVLETDDAY
ncbi:ketoacyl-ACP synthase III [Dyella jejuensis]|uniref:Ketoacyl-ACP synthase III n=1 Tax=Dyella jejuensis TaxID=1432009 RepID=A0ABW8JN36_9GAMM